jgi:hypothetical protein
MVEQIWFKDIPHFLTKTNYNRFFPSRDMTFPEQLNSLLRLSLYFSVVVFVLRHNSNVFMIPIFMGLFTYFLYTVDVQNKSNERQYFKENNLKMDTHTKEICQEPTKNNPFMNVLISDYALNPQRHRACNVTKKTVKKKAQGFFDTNLYRSVSDIFNKEASDRQWVTNPNTEIPNRQTDFAKWCYELPKTCKEGAGNVCHTNMYRSINA